MSRSSSRGDDGFFQTSRAAAGQQEQNTVLRLEILGQLQAPVGGGKGAVVGDRWPASQTQVSEGPSLWPCLVMTMPPSSLRSRLSQAGCGHGPGRLTYRAGPKLSCLNSFPARSLEPLPHRRTCRWHSPDNGVPQSFSQPHCRCLQNKFILPVPLAGSRAQVQVPVHSPGCQLPCRCGCTAKIKVIIKPGIWSYSASQKGHWSNWVSRGGDSPGPG